MESDKGTWILRRWRSSWSFDLSPSFWVSFSADSLTGLFCSWLRRYSTYTENVNIKMTILQVYISKENSWHLLLMGLLQLHQLLLVLHVHGWHDTSLISQHLPQVLHVPFLLFDFALQFGISGFSRHQLDRGGKVRTFGNTGNRSLLMQPQMYVNTCSSPQPSGA